MVIGWYYGSHKDGWGRIFAKKNKKKFYRKKLKKILKKISKKISKIPIEIYFIYIMGGLAEWVDYRNGRMGGLEEWVGWKIYHVMYNNGVGLGGSMFL